MNVNTGVRKAFSWTFLVGHVTEAIIEADFLHHFGLVVDVQSKPLIDQITSLQVRCAEKQANVVGLRAILDTPSTYQHALRK